MLNNVLHKVNRVLHHETQNQQQPVNWNATLDGLTEIEVVKEVRDLLLNVNLARSKNIIHDINIVLQADERAYARLQDVTYNYLIPLRNNENLRNETREIAYEYLRTLYKAYSFIVSKVLSDNRSLFNMEQTTLILARYLNAGFMMTKWRYFEDQPAAVGIWKNVHHVIRMAEDLSVMNKDLFLYGHQNKETSIAAILKRGFMLDTLQQSSYTQLQIELTDRILRTWATNPWVTNRFKEDAYQFFIHLDEDKRPQRLRGAKHHPDFRYWATERIVDLIEAYLCAVDTKKPLDEFNLATMAATKDVVELFKKLRVDWCVKGYKRQRRSEPRVSKYEMLNVSHGVDSIYARARFLENKPERATTEIRESSLELMPDNSSTFMPSVQDTALIPTGRENWSMLEESVKGFSVEIGKELSGWVKSGALVGYLNPENKRTIALAEIKAIRKRANGTHRVGLSKLCGEALPLKVFSAVKSNPFEMVKGYQVDDGEEETLVFSDMFSGLLINDDTLDHPRLIVPRHRYKKAKRFKVDMHGEEHLVLAGELIHSHREWVCFEMIMRK